MVLLGKYILTHPTIISITEQKVKSIRNQGDLTRERTVEYSLQLVIYGITIGLLMELQLVIYGIKFQMSDMTDKLELQEMRRNEKSLIEQI